MDGGKASAVAGVEGLQQIKGFLPAYLSQDGAFGSVPQACFQKIADGDGRNPGSLLSACLKAHEVWFADVDFCCVFDNHQSVFIGNEIGKDVEQSRFACAGATADEDVSPVNDGVVKVSGHCFGDGANADEVFDGEAAGIELADGEGNSMNAAWGQDGCDAAAIRQSRIEDGFFLRDVVAECAGDVLHGHAQLIGGNGDALDLFHDTLLFYKYVRGRVEHDLADLGIENEALNRSEIWQDQPVSGMYVGCAHTAFAPASDLFDWGGVGETVLRGRTPPRLLLVLAGSDFQV